MFFVAVNFTIFFKSFSKEDTLLTTRFVVKYTDGSRNRGSREGEGVFPLSAGSLETRGFKCVLYGAFFAQESSWVVWGTGPIKGEWGTAP